MNCVIITNKEIFKLSNMPNNVYKVHKKIFQFFQVV